MLKNKSLFKNSSVSFAFIEKSWENLKSIRILKGGLIKIPQLPSPSFKKKSSSKSYSYEEHIFRFLVVALMSDLFLTLHLNKAGNIFRDKNLIHHFTIFSLCQVCNSWPWFISSKWNTCLCSFAPLKWSISLTFWYPVPQVHRKKKYSQKRKLPSTKKLSTPDQNWALPTPRLLVCLLFML